MYTPSYFSIADQGIIDQFIRDNSFGTLISLGDPYPLATHIPLELEINATGNQVIRGHISKANGQWKSFATHPQVLVTFVSPVDHYISSSWYEQPNVPTWNYISVQVTGQIKILEGEEKKESLRRIMDKYEQKSNHPVSFNTLPAEVHNQMHGIVAFEILIDKKEANFKLSQNRNKKDFENIIHELKTSGNAASVNMAELMIQFRKD